MDGGADRLESELLIMGKCLLELFRTRLCPIYVRDEDMILLISPWEEADFRVGIYLYDIQDYSLTFTAETELSSTQRRFPPKAVELSYLIFCNQKHRFGGVPKEQLQTVLSEVIRIVYDHPELEIGDGERVRLSFLREDVEFKMRLWGSFDRPLQPAVYIKAEPVRIASRRKRSVSQVREREYDVEGRER
ncbi:MAG: DUF4255 domain-containing protein [bacterium]|nr:DUF4255 domain-containing protein [bacterium]MCM1374321.1 DUF4255 domain-containing protein [Muribaculum sp.]